MQWFRLYGTMPDDPKIGTLTDAEFRTWVELLCLACRDDQNGVTTATLDNINWQLRRNVTVTLQALLQRGLIYTNDTGTIIITRWNDRQKPSDRSSDRVRKFREKKACNVTETVVERFSNGLDLDLEREKEKKEKKEKKSYPIEFENFWSNYPRHDCSKADAAKSYEKAIKENISHECIHTALAAFREYIRLNKTENRFIPHAATWLNAKSWEADYSVRKQQNQFPTQTDVFAE